MNFSAYQTNVFDWVREGEGNGFINAVAGSGKTTTIVECIKHIEPDKKILFLAFNKHIAETLRKRVPANVNAMTLNALGHRAVLGRYFLAKVDTNTTLNYFAQSCGIEYNQQRQMVKTYGSTLRRLISLIKSLACYTVDHEVIDELMTNYTIDFPVSQTDQLKEYVCRTLQNYWNTLDGGMVNTFDFDDQLYIPVYNKLTLPTFDWVFVDEAQDLNPIQIELLEMLMKEGTRLLAVGDPQQAIYGFRGSDPFAIETLKTNFEVKEMPLSICYRCPKKVVAEAKYIVPQIEECSSSEEGVVTDIPLSEFRKKVVYGDYVLCRTTAPLISECLKFIEKGTKAQVVGRNIGENLIDFVEVLCPEGVTSVEVSDLINRVNAYQSEKIKYFIEVGNDSKVIEIQDKCETIRVLGNAVKGYKVTANDIILMVRRIFSDNAEGIVFCTVHRAKGLEANNIFILNPELMPHPKCSRDWQKVQENNLKYVAITRAMKNLTYIREDKAE